MLSTLALTMDQIKAQVAFHQGWSRGTAYDETEWTDREQFAIDGIVNAGLDRFYRPHVPGVLDAGYSWSFMRPTVSLTLASGTRYVVLPDDFGGLEGEIAVSSSSSTGHAPLPVTADAWRHYAFNDNVTGPPRWASLQCQAPNSKGQKFHLQVFPEADAAYTLEFQYYLHGQALTASFPYPLGGAEHAQTVLEACLSVSEERLDDMPAMSGPHGQAFLNRLMASVAVDRKKKPQLVGAMRDDSDECYYPGRRRIMEDPVITFDGVQYD